MRFEARGTWRGGHVDMIRETPRTLAVVSLSFGLPVWWIPKIIGYGKCGNSFIPKQKDASGFILGWLLFAIQYEWIAVTVNPLNNNGLGDVSDIYVGDMRR